MSASVVIDGRLAGAVLAAMLALPTAAAAQSPLGPFADLFGRTPPQTGRELTRVELRTTLGGQYDGALADGGVPANPSAGPTGAVAGGTTTVGFERRRDRLLLRGMGSGTYQEFFAEPRNGAASYDAGLTAVAKVATKFTVDAMASARRSPFFELTPGAPLSGTDVRVPSDRFTSRALRNDSFEGALGFTSQFARRSSIGATVTRRDTRFPDSSGYNYSGWGGRGDFRHGLSRNATLHLAYGREDARQKSLGDGRYVHETIHAGVDLDRSLSLARRTALSLYSQPSVLRESGGPRRFRLNGGVTLRRDFGRTWNASLLLNRDTEFHPGFVAPLFSHGGGLSIGGLLAKRVEWTSNVGARRGQLGFDGTLPFTSYSGISRLSMAFTRKLGLYGQYSFYHYELPPGATVVELLPRYSRQQLSVGLSFWLPIYTHLRATRDPR